MEDLWHILDGSWRVGLVVVVLIYVPLLIGRYICRQQDVDDAWGAGFSTSLVTAVLLLISYLVGRGC